MPNETASVNSVPATRWLGSGPDRPAGIPVLAHPDNPLKLTIGRFANSSKQSDSTWEAILEPDRRRNIMDALGDKNLVVSWVAREKWQEAADWWKEQWEPIRNVFGKGTRANPDPQHWICGIPQAGSGDFPIIHPDSVPCPPGTTRFEITPIETDPSLIGAEYFPDRREIRVAELLSTHDRTQPIVKSGTLRVSERRADVRDQRKRLVGYVVEGDIDQLSERAERVGTKTKYIANGKALALWLPDHNFNFTKQLAAFLRIQWIEPNYVEQMFGQLADTGRDPPDPVPVAA